MTTEDDVLRIVAEVLDQSVEQLRVEDHFITDLGASSLDIVTLVMRIEQHFDLEETPDEKLEQISTIGDLVQLVLSIQGVDGADGDESVVVDVAIASDHAALGLKNELAAWLRQHGWNVQDLGPLETLSVDYPEFAGRVARRVARGEARHGILLCGTGIGMSIAANKVGGVRAALVHSALEARLAREHNNANVLCLGARIIGPLAAKDCVETFLATEFDPGDNGRHQRRINLITALAEEHG